jgi:ketosteroid isomerase-like protein
LFANEVQNAEKGIGRGLFSGSHELVNSSVDKDKKTHSHSSSLNDVPARGSERDESHLRVTPEMRRPKPGPDAIAAALEAAQRLAAEVDAEQAAEDVAQHLPNDGLLNDSLANEVTVMLCTACGHQNRVTNKFCSMCGAAVETGDAEGAMAEKPAQKRGPTPVTMSDEPRRPRPIALHPNPFLDPEPEPERPAPARRLVVDPYPGLHAEPQPPAHSASGMETHHYHHHYHHHFFPGAEGVTPGMASGSVPRAGSEPAREADRFRPTAALRGDMTRAEAAVRRIAHEWVLACNTKHLDDLLDLYIPDALVLRSNYPLIRGAAAVREFLFGAIDAGLGEVELEPLRVEVVGDLAYDTGRCKALVPSPTGKRREERGKYLWVCARQSGGEWKLAVDCWSSDLTLAAFESDLPPGAGVKSGALKKS